MGAHIILTVALNSELMDGLRNAVSPWGAFMKDSGKKRYLCNNDTFNSLDLKLNSLKRSK